jgi:hypothetical protein
LAQTPGEVTVRGTLTAIHVDNLDDRISAGSVVIGKERLVVPSTVMVQMPGGQLTLQERFTFAPARCLEKHESGLVPADVCRRPAPDDSGKTPVWTLEADRTPRSYLDPTPTDEAPPTVARVAATRGADGALVATAITLTRTDRSVAGAVTFVNEEEGYLRINGALGADEGGALLRINDPEGRQSVQRGAGCGAQGNCSPDARFKANTATMSVRFEAGYAACVPGGLGSVCSQNSRPVRGLIDGNASRLTELSSQTLKEIAAIAGRFDEHSKLLASARGPRRRRPSRGPLKNTVGIPAPHLGAGRGARRPARGARIPAI